MGDENLYICTKEYYVALKRNELHIYILLGVVSSIYYYVKNSKVEKSIYAIICLRKRVMNIYSYMYFYI